MYDLVIIGGGPTGINIAVAAQQANLNYIVLEKGMLVNSLFHFPSNMTFFSTSKNLEIVDMPFISHTDKPTRKESLEYYRRIVEHHQLKINYYEEVEKVEKEGSAFSVQSSRGNYQAKNVVVATGFYDVPRKLNVPGEDLPKVKHYYGEAHPYVGQNLLVIGGANSACDVALETWQKGADVTMVIRQSDLYSRVKYWILPNIKNRIAEGSIPAYFNSTVEEIKERSVLINTPEGSIEIENDYVLAMTGYQPDYKLLERVGVPILTDEDLSPDFDPKTLETSVPGLYVAGVLNAGMKTSSLFIENTRHHAALIIDHITASLEQSS